MLLVLTGPSGVGKTTLAKMFLSKYSFFKKAITFTTRPPRKGEVNGADYYFISKDEFDNMLRNKEFFEYALVYDNYYGVSIKELERIKNANSIAILVLDVQGARKIKECFSESLVIFLTPPSIEVLKERILGRENKEDIDLLKRIARAEKEISLSDEFDYVVKNEKLGIAFEEIEGIIFSSGFNINETK